MAPGGKRRPIVAFVLLAVGLALAGCTGDGDPGDGDADPAPSTPVPDPLAMAGGQPAWVFDTPGSDKETALAVHPTDARRAAVTWAEDIQRVWVATTRDAGASWTQMELDDGNCAMADDLSPVGCQHGFDTIAAYGPDGTLFVMYGRGGGPDGLSGGGMVVAASGDDGASWDYRSVTGLVEPHLWDAMDLAVAPDSGHLAVVAQSVAHRSIGLWRSADAGRTWTGPTFPIVSAAASAGDEADPTAAVYWPRIAAGPGGLLVVTAKSFAPPAARVTVSHDGGATFLPWQAFDLPGGGSLIGDPAAIAPDGQRVDLVFGGLHTLWRVSSGDRGGQWTEPEPFAELPDDRVVAWPVSALGADGRLRTLASTADDGANDWGLVLVSEGPDGSGVVRELASSTVRRPAGGGAGDEYGGLAVAADGAVWASWADPRQDPESPRILAARFP